MNKIRLDSQSILTNLINNLKMLKIIVYKWDRITQKQLALGKMYHQQRKINNNKKYQSKSLFKCKRN